MRIDAHQHFWYFDPVRDSWIDDSMKVLRDDFLPEDLIPILKTHHLDGSVAVQADQSERETEFLLSLADRIPEIAGVVGWVDLQSPDLNQRLASFATHPKLCGVRHIAQTEPEGFLRRPEINNGIAQLAEFNLTYDILIYERQIEDAVYLVERFPDQVFVLDHLGKPDIRSGKVTREWSAGIRKLAAHPHVYCKVSGLVTEADQHSWQYEDLVPYLDIVTESFGVDKLIYGSDWPVCLLAAEYARVYDVVDRYFANLPADKRTRIFGMNAIEAYQLKLNNTSSQGNGSQFKR